MLHQSRQRGEDLRVVGRYNGPAPEDDLPDAVDGVVPHVVLAVPELVQENGEQVLQVAVQLALQTEILATI